MTEPVAGLTPINPRNYIRDLLMRRVSSDPVLLNKYENNPDFNALLKLLYRGRDDGEIVDRIVEILSAGQCNPAELSDIEDRIALVSMNEEKQKHG